MFFYVTHPQDILVFLYTCICNYVKVLNPHLTELFTPKKQKCIKATMWLIYLQAKLIN